MPTRRFAIVTGTSSGIGFAVTQRLLDHGWDVVGVSRRDPAHAHPRYTHLQLDLADLSGLAAAFEGRVAPLVRDEAWSRMGVVNNAADAGLLAPVETLAPLELARMFALNAVTPIWCMGFVSRHCARNVLLRVVNVSSAAAVRPLPGLAAYGSSKAALRMAGMVLSAEWQSTVAHAPARADATVLSYEPGAVDTPMQTHARTRPVDEFPWVGMFTASKDRGALVPAERPAQEIVEYLEGDGHAPFSERRLEQPR